MNVSLITVPDSFWVPMIKHYYKILGHGYRQMYWDFSPCSWNSYLAHECHLMMQRFQSLIRWIGSHILDPHWHYHLKIMMALYDAHVEAGKKRKLTNITMKYFCHFVRIRTHLLTFSKSIKQAKEMLLVYKIKMWNMNVVNNRIDLVNTLCSNCNKERWIFNKL